MPSTRPSFARRMLSGYALTLGLLASLSAPALAAGDAPWILDPAASRFSFMSVKKNAVVEPNIFRTITGEIAPDGTATVTFDLNSIDTNVDLRNVRMRFLFFETFKFPAATLSAKVDPAMFADLPTVRRKTVPLGYTLSLHGIEKSYTSDVVVTLIDDTRVSVSSAVPIVVQAADFDLAGNIEKLQQAANVNFIVPATSVTFDFLFQTNGAGFTEAVASASPAELEPIQVAGLTPLVPTAARGGEIRVALPGAAPLSDDYTVEECANRFESLSQTGAIYFASGSAVLESASRPLLEETTEIIRRCPQVAVEVAGHTDSDGSDSMNLSLSTQRAGAVAAFLLDAGVEPGRVSAIGYGEARPVAPNDTPNNKARNRRIEFVVRGEIR